MKYFVADIAPINKESKRYYNEAGYLVLPKCKIACSGVLQYSDVMGHDGKVIADGDLINVLRPQEALKECVNQFANLPVTLEHPDGDEVNSENAKQLIVGSLGSNPEYIVEDGVLYIVNDIIIYDKEAQKKIESDEFAELSAGYHTAFRRRSGVENGEAYDAEQFILEPNHVALVEQGRCGSKCRVCDHLEIKEKGRQMARKSNKQKFKYFLQVADNAPAIELTEEQVKALENQEVEFEEVDEDDIEIQEECMDMDDLEVQGEEVNEEDMDMDEEDEDIEDEDIEETVEDEESEETETEDIEETVEDEESEGEFEEEMTEEDEDVEETTDEDMFTVRFDDGTVGKMDANAYEHCKRYMEMSKKGDSAQGQTFAKTLLVTHRATEVLGDKFDLNKFVVGDSVDVASIKKAVVAKVLPNIELKGVKGDSLERLYDMAYKTHKKNKKEYSRDMQNISLMSEPVADSKINGMVEKNREAYLKRIRGNK